PRPCCTSTVSSYPPPPPTHTHPHTLPGGLPHALRHPRHVAPLPITALPALLRCSVHDPFPHHLRRHASPPHLHTHTTLPLALSLSLFLSLSFLNSFLPFDGNPSSIHALS